MPDTHLSSFYIGGAWVAPLSQALIDVVDPATGEPFTQIAAAGVDDVDRAVAAARAAFPAYAATTREEIFGPVLSILGYADEDDAVRIANDTPYGLASYVQSGNGREWGEYGLHEYLEFKGIVGYE